MPVSANPDSGTWSAVILVPVLKNEKGLGFNIKVRFQRSPDGKFEDIPFDGLTDVASVDKVILNQLAQRQVVNDFDPASLEGKTYGVPIKLTPPDPTPEELARRAYIGDVLLYRELSIAVIFEIGDKTKLRDDVKARLRDNFIEAYLPLLLGLGLVLPAP